MLKKIALIVSMFLISYIGDDGVAGKSFFASWFIFLLLLVIDYIENFNFNKIEMHHKIEEGYKKKFDKTRLSTYFYFVGIIIFGFFTFVNLLGALGLFLIEDMNMTPDSNNILIKGLFYLIPGNSINVEVFVLIKAVFFVVFFVGEFFAKPTLSYQEKYNLKYNESRREVT